MEGFKRELEENILRFWSEKMIDHKFGGFYGTIDGHNRLVAQANKGAVMHMRILWTFSAAYRVLGNPSYREVADHAYAYVCQHFIDHEFGGVYWEVDYLGNPVQSKKQTYAQGFALYAFSEYYRATKVPDALELSIGLFKLIESFCKDSVKGGYWEAFTQDWQPLEDMRLSDKDENEAKTMNTHLHILEPYTNLLRIWPDDDLLRAQRELIGTFSGKIYNPQTGHLQLFFNEDWQVKGTVVSYGHDIEAAWLLWEAAEMIGDQDLLNKIEPICLHIAEAAREGLMDDGSMAYELKGNYLDKERHWWVQAEAVVGFSYMHRLNNDEDYKGISSALWKYIRQQLVDSENGEWYWSRLDNGEVNRVEDKAGFWKCPYHNGRMCLEMIENFSLL